MLLQDLRHFKSQKTNRGPLQEGWIDRQDPIMCSYKLVTVKFEVWGLQTRVEQFVHKVRIARKATKLCNPCRRLSAPQGLRFLFCWPMNLPLHQPAHFPQIALRQPCTAEFIPHISYFPKAISAGHSKASVPGVNCPRPLLARGAH